MCAVKFLIVMIMSVNSLLSPLAGYVREAFERFFDSAPTAADVSQPQIVYEAATGKVISAENENEVFHAGHFAKLMTLLLVQEAAESGDISYDTQFTVSSYANSMQGTQIWLDVSEKITVEELIKAITVGNANDACVALAEGTMKSEGAFVEAMNVRAAELGMLGTHYADCTGISSDTVTTAYDTALLCAELSKHEQIFPYMTTWIDTVRDGKAQLVNLNRLVRSYNGIIGMKACYSDGSGNCIAAAAQRGDMIVIAVMSGYDDEDSRFTWAKDKMDRAFAAYEVYTPVLSDGAIQDISVLGGVKSFCRIDYTDKSTVLIPKGRADSIDISFERVEAVQAPIEQGTIIGTATFMLGDEEIFTTDLCAAESVDKLSYIDALQRLLLELLKL